MDENSSAVAESWEDVEFEDIDKNVEKFVKGKTTEEEKETSKPADRVVLCIEDSHRTPYTPPVRILQRNVDSSNSSESLEKKREQTQNKSLEQREAEYAEARRRILGAPETSSSGGGVSIARRSTDHMSPSNS